ncbi:hypothetical protein FQR65_LT12455 [Abscondita terminalis]|nr:hypothetical protein FQR65_LT12455 [Abscondita terminalis]
MNLDFKDVFPVLHNSFALPFVEVSDYKLIETVDAINQMKLASTIQALVFHKVEKYVREQVSPEFWSYFANTDNVIEGFSQFYKAIKLLHGYYTQFLYLMRNVNVLRERGHCNEVVYGERNSVQVLKVIIRATLLSQLPLQHSKVIEYFYETGLKMEDRDNRFQEKNL